MEELEFGQLNYNMAVGNNDACCFTCDLSHQYALEYDSTFAKTMSQEKAVGSQPLYPLIYSLSSLGTLHDNRDAESQEVNMHWAVGIERHQLR